MREDVGLTLRQEFEAADAEFSPVVEADPVVENIVKHYNVTDATIAEMKAKYSGLTIAGLEDKKGYEVVHAARMHAREVRLAVEKTRVRLKADSLEYGKKVDREAKRITAEISPIEAELEAKEAKYEAEVERIKAEKQAEAAAKLQKRIETLQAYGQPFTLAEITAMTDTAFGFLEATAKDAWEAREKLRIEAEAALARQKAEQEAKAEADRKAKEEAEAAERARLEKVREEQAAEAKRIEEGRAALRKEQEEFQAKKAEMDRMEREKKIAEEAAAKAKAKVEQDAKDAAEKARREQEEAAARQKAAEAAKPDAEKIRALAKVIRELAIPKLATDAGRAVQAEIENAVTRLATFVDGKANAIAPITPNAAP